MRPKKAELRDLSMFEDEHGESALETKIAIDTRVIDPGEWDGACFHRFTEAGNPMVGLDREVGHAWQLARLHEAGCVWFCARCRRVEERRIELTWDE